MIGWNEKLYLNKYISSLIFFEPIFPFILKSSTNARVNEKRESSEIDLETTARTDTTQAFSDWIYACMDIAVRLHATFSFFPFISLTSLSFFSVLWISRCLAVCEFYRISERELVVSILVKRWNSRNLFFLCSIDSIFQAFRVKESIVNVKKQSL